MNRLGRKRLFWTKVQLTVPTDPWHGKPRGRCVGVAEQYRSQMIPRAEKSYRLYLQEYNNMQGAYPQALIAQRTLIPLRTDYITALETL
jgi:hypothetical protein